MSQAVRVRVTWDDTVIDDRVVDGGTELRIGAGVDANVPAPGRSQGAYVRVRPQGAALELVADAGTADWVEVAGEERVIGGAAVRRTLNPPFDAVTLGFGATTGTPTTVEVVGSGLAPKRERDVGLLLWTMVGVTLGLVLAAIVLYVLVLASMRLFGNGDAHDRLRALSRDEAARFRVTLAPEGSGATRVQTGAGQALHRPKSATALTPKGVAGETPRPKPVKRGRPKSLPVGADVARLDTGVRPDGADDGRPREEVQVKPEPRRTRAQRIEEAQAALLDANLRKAVDSFSKADRESPLDYDQLNWMGLAQYLSGELAEAESTWTRAREMSPGRVDAVNNLASVKKRRGDTAGERALLDEALKLRADDCHASNSLALALAKAGETKRALETLAESDGYCGGNYAYTSIQRAGILALSGDRDGAFKALEEGLGRVDTMIPIKEFEVATDLRLDPAFASLRRDPRFASLIAKYLPRAASWNL
jgi:tetratricopeptide (TPR) repeat protein